MSMQDAIAQRADYLATLRKIRKEAADEIERLISLLDRIEVDPDLEPDVDAEPDEDGEPSLGSINPNFGIQSQAQWSAGCSDDTEDEHDGREASLCGVTFEAPCNARDLEWDAGDMPEGIPW
jgi:hypothetical protein